MLDALRLFCHILATQGCVLGVGACNLALAGMARNTAWPACRCSLRPFICPGPQLYEYPWRKTSRQQQDSVPQAGSAGGTASSNGGATNGDGSGGGSQRRSLRYEVQDPTRNRRLQPVPMRPATSQEPTPYLQARWRCASGSKPSSIDRA